MVIDAFVRAEEVTLGNALNLVDGSIFNRWRNGREPRNTYNTWSHITIDLGAVYPVDFVRLITGIAIRGGFGEHLLRTRAGASGPRSFSYKNYEVLTSDGTIAPDGTRIWTRHFAGYPGQRKPQSRTSRPPVPHPASPLRPHRLANLGCHLRHDPARTTPRAGFATPTAQPRRSKCTARAIPSRSISARRLIDLGSGKNLNSIEWQAQTPFGTHIEIRSRTGNEVVEQYTFYDKNGKQVNPETLRQTDPQFQGQNRHYARRRCRLESLEQYLRCFGRGFPVALAAPLYGTRCALGVQQARHRLPNSTGWPSTSGDPLASKVVGEVFPLQVAPGQETLFSYFLRPRDNPRWLRPDRH